MAEALVWHCIRDHNSFLHKAGRTSRAGEVQFSKEAGNVMAVNTFKYSGLANNKACSVEAGAAGIVLKRKNAKSAGKPSKTMSTIPMKANKKHALKVLKNLVGTNKYRADLASAVSARYLRLHEATYARGSKSAKNRRGDVATFGDSIKKVHKHRKAE